MAEILVFSNIFGFLAVNCIHKENSQNELKISFLTQLQPFLNTSIKTVAYLINHLVCHHWSNKIDNIFGSSGQKTTQKQLKIIVSVRSKAFENSILENYISNINKNCQVCIPS